MADTATSTRIDLARQYLALQQARNVDELVAMMADDVELIMPMLGTIDPDAGPAPEGAVPRAVQLIE